MCVWLSADKKVGDVEPPAPGPVTEGDNFVLKVHSATVVIDKKRVDGTPVRIAEVVVGDETGCITFRARNGTCAAIESLTDADVHSTR